MAFKKMLFINEKWSWIMLLKICDKDWVFTILQRQQKTNYTNIFKILTLGDSLDL